MSLIELRRTILFWVDLSHEKYTLLSSSESVAKSCYNEHRSTLNVKIICKFLKYSVSTQFLLHAPLTPHTHYIAEIPIPLGWTIFFCHQPGKKNNCPNIWCCLNWNYFYINIHTTLSVRRPLSEVRFHGLLKCSAVSWKINDSVITSIYMK